MSEVFNSKAPIFITGRFRSGTSFMWQIFNQLDGFCAWYEPLHPQLLSAIKHTSPKEDHVGIDDYWQVYRDRPEFETAYEDEFALKSLYLEEEDEYPELEKYINNLIQLSGNDRAVLQFNRVDLRLPWLKAKFPDAKIIHINRNPLQLFHSQRKHMPSQYVDDVMYWDAYELPSWCFALANRLPIFSVISDQKRPAFYDFYLIYKLSQLMAKQHADVCIDLDQQIFQSKQFIDDLQQVVDLSVQQQKIVLELINVPESPIFSEAEADEMAEVMTKVDLVLTESGLNDYFGQLPLEKIKSSFQDYWLEVVGTNVNVLPILLEIEKHKHELTRLLAENASLKNQLSLALEQVKTMNNEGVDE